MKVFVVTLILIGGLVGQALAQQPLNQRVADLEKRVAELEQRMASLHGAQVGTPAPEETGYALTFDGKDDVVMTSLKIDQTDSSSGVTMEAWVYPTSHATGRHHIISTDDGGYDWSILTEGNTWYVFTGRTSQATSFRVDLNTWQHVAAVFIPGTGVTFYKDGQEEMIGPVAFDTKANPVMIGDNPGSWKQYFAGRIDEVRVWEAIRTQDQIRTYMNQPLTGRERGLLAYWRFDDGSGKVAKDATGNRHDGRIDGAQWVQRATRTARR